MNLMCGDSLEELKKISDESVDSLITDPPAGISFMGKDWDNDKGGREAWIEWMKQVMQECLRVLKPGAHGLVWAIPRTSHWTATALEDAGFEVRDVVTHLFGSGFPKSLNVGKQTGLKEHEGIGTALKPASEHWILVRKPCSEKTVAANVLKHGTGGINIDASRIFTNEDTSRITNAGIRGNNFNGGLTEKGPLGGGHTQGRFPANLVLSHNEDCEETCTEGCAVAMLDEQSGTLKSGGGIKVKAGKHTSPGGWVEKRNQGPNRESNSGAASRFFYCAKASKREKGEGNIHPTVKATKLMSYLIKMITPPNGIVLDPFMGSGSTGVAAKQLGFKFIGIEKEHEYMTIAENRIKAILV